MDCGSDSNIGSVDTVEPEPAVQEVLASVPYMSVTCCSVVVAFLVSHISAFCQNVDAAYFDVSRTF